MEMSIIAFTLKMIAGSLPIRYKCEMSSNSSPTHRNFHLKSPTKKLALAKTNQHSTTNLKKKTLDIFKGNTVGYGSFIRNCFLLARILMFSSKTTNRTIARTSQRVFIDK